MAISHVHLLPLFLASLHFLPAFSALYPLQFEYCKGVANNVGNITEFTRSSTDVKNRYTLYLSVDTKNDLDIGLGTATLDVTNDEMEFPDGRFYYLTTCVDSVPIGYGKHHNFNFTRVPSKNEHPELSTKVYDKGTLKFFGPGQSDEDLCITFNPNSYTASAAAVSA